MNEVVSYKVYLCAAGFEPEIRRMTIDKDISHNYFFLKQKLVSIFPALRETQFTISWKDQEGDTVRICTDEELQIALLEMGSQDFKKIYVSSTPQQGNEGPIHPNVSCNGCGHAIQGFRYKCIECVDVDLCPDCERAQNHPDHPMIRIPLPVNIEEPLCRRWFYKISKNVEHLYQACERSEKRGRGEGKREKRCQRGGSCPVMNTGEDFDAQFFNVFRRTRGTNPQSGATGTNQETTATTDPQGEAANPISFFQALSEQDPLQFCEMIRQGLSSFLDPLGCPEYATPNNSREGADRENDAGDDAASPQAQPAQSQEVQPKPSPAQSQEAQPQPPPVQSQEAQTQPPSAQSQEAQTQPPSVLSQDYQPQPQTSQSQEHQPQPPQGQEQAPVNQPGTSQAQPSPHEQAPQSQSVLTQSQEQASPAQPQEKQSAQTLSEGGAHEKLYPNVPKETASQVHPEALHAQPHAFHAQPQAFHAHPHAYHSHPQLQIPGFIPGRMTIPSQVQPVHPQTAFQTHAQSYPAHPFFPQPQQTSYFPPAQPHIFTSVQSTFPAQPQTQPPVPQQVCTKPVTAREIFLNHNAARSKTLENTFMNLHLNSEVRSRSPQPYRLLRKGSREESPGLDNTWTVLQKPEQGAGDSAEAVPTVSAAEPKPILDEVPVKPVTSSGNSAVDETLARLTAMGFTNEGDWLKELVEEKKCDLNEVLQFLMPIPKPKANE